jgi:hypothetical protein
MSMWGQYPLSAHIQVDDENDLIVSYGVKISGVMLRTLGEPTPPGRWFRVVKVEDGMATIETKMEE